MKRRGQLNGKSRSTAYQSSTAQYPITRRLFTNQVTSVNPFPLRMNTRLVYGTNITLTTAGSSVNGVKFTMSLNSLYDPEVSSTGHQPYQFDQLTSIYQNYFVRSAYVDMTFTDPTADGLWVGWILRSQDDSGDDLSTLDLGRAMERPNLRVFPLNNTGAQNVTCSMRVPIHEILGIDRAQYLAAYDYYGAQYNFSPTKQVYLDLLLWDPTGLVSTHSVRCVGRIVYDCQFWNYTAPTPS